MTSKPNVALRVRRDGLTWRIEPAGDVSGTVSEAERATAMAGVNDRLTEMASRLSGHPETWRLELIKSAFTSGRTSPGLAHAFVIRAMASPGESHVIVGSADEVSAFAIAAALRGAGASVTGQTLSRLVTALSAVAALPAGLAAAGLAALRARRWPSRLPAGIRVAVAVHAEAVKRTGHILKILPTLDPDTTALIVIGWPVMRFDAVRQLLADHGWTGPVVRCLDPFAIMAGLPRALLLALAGPRAILAGDRRPAWRDQVAAMFRIALGAAGSAWWDRQATRPGVVVYGHNGLADTVLMERAQQASGARTVHWMHGTSAGRIYDGVSDLCVHQCGHDARWHDRLGGYGRNISFPAARPAFRQGGSGWVVLTNFTHPDYAFYPSVGPGHELALMEVVAAAAAKAGVAPDAVVWKPHPIFFQVEPETRRRVTETLAAHGFRLWPQEDRDFSRCAAFETIITTPSGAALDVLKLGRLPVMAAFHPVDPDHMLSCFPLRSGDARALLRDIATAADASAAEVLFDQTWRSIGPGRTPAFSEIVEAAQGAS